MLCWLLMAMSFVVSYPLCFRSARDTATDIMGLPTPGGGGGHGHHGAHAPPKPRLARRRPSRSDSKDEVMFNELVRSRSKDSEPPPEPLEQPEQRGLRWVLAVSAMVVAINAIGIWVDDLGFLLAFRGALLGCPLCFILPGIVLLRLAHCPGYWRARAKALVAFGVVGGLLGCHFSLAHRAAGGER